MKEFILRIVSHFQGRGAEEARRGLEGVEQQARQAQSQAEPGRFRRWFSELGSGARRATGQLRAMMGAMRGIIGLGFGAAIGLMVNSLRNLADQTRRSADMTGLTNTQWQALAFTGRELKVRVETLETALTGMNRRMVDNEEDFRRAGIQVRAANGEYRDTIDVLKDVADTVSGMSSAQERAALTQRLMGRAGQQMLPILNRGGEAMQHFMDEAERRGQILDDDSIDRLNEAGDRIEALRVRMVVMLGDAIDGWARVNRSVSNFLTTTEMMRDTLREEAVFAREIVDTVKDEEEARRAVEGLRELALQREKDMESANRATRSRLEQQAQLLRYQADILENNLQSIVRRNVEEAEAEKIKARQERLDEAARVIAEAKAELARTELSAKERLAELESEIVSLKEAARSGEEGSVEAAVRLSALLKEQAKLNEEITAEKNAQAETDREAAAAQEENLKALQKELEIMRAKAAGQTDLAARLEHERDLRERTRRIVDETGLSEAEARAIARDKLALERQIADQKRGQKDAAEALTAEERRRRELLEQAARDPFGRGLEGRQAIRELQGIGEISTTQRVAQEQLLALQTRRQRGEDIFAAGSTTPPAAPAAPAHRPAAGPAAPPPTSDSSAARGGGVEREGRRAVDVTRDAGDRIVESFRDIADAQQSLARRVEQLAGQIRASRN